LKGVDQKKGSQIIKQGFEKEKVKRRKGQQIVTKHKKRHGTEWEEHNRGKGEKGNEVSRRTNGGTKHQ